MNSQFRLLGLASLVLATAAFNSIGIQPRPAPETSVARHKDLIEQRRLKRLHRGPKAPPPVVHEIRTEPGYLRSTEEIIDSGSPLLERIIGQDGQETWTYNPDYSIVMRARTHYTSTYAVEVLQTGFAPRSYENEPANARYGRGVSILDPYEKKKNHASTMYHWENSRTIIKRIKESVEFARNEYDRRKLKRPELLSSIHENDWPRIPMTMIVLRELPDAQGRPGRIFATMRILHSYYHLPDGWDPRLGDLKKAVPTLHQPADFPVRWKENLQVVGERPTYGMPFFLEPDDLYAYDPGNDRVPVSREATLPMEDHLLLHLPRGKVDDEKYGVASEVGLWVMDGTRNLIAYAETSSRLLRTMKALDGYVKTPDANHTYMQADAVIHKMHQRSRHQFDDLHPEGIIPIEDRPLPPKEQGKWWGMEVTQERLTQLVSEIGLHRHQYKDADRVSPEWIQTIIRNALDASD